MERAQLWFFLFPVVYFLHELEELISFKQAKKQGIKQVPRILQASFKALSFARFFKAILLESFFMLLIRLGSWYAETSFWFAVSIVFTVHFLFHFLQALVLKNWTFWARSSLILLPIASLFIFKSFPGLYSEFFWKELLMALVLMVLFFSFLFSFFRVKKDCFLYKKS